MIREIIGTEKFDDTILIETDDRLPVHITFKNVILIRCVLRNGDKFSLQLFLEEDLVAQILVGSW